MTEGKNVVLCYGVLAVDQIIQPEAFPQPDGHTRLLSNQEYLRGESTNVALTLAGLGVPARLMGSTLGDDDRGRWFLEQVKDTGVDCRHLQVDRKTRTTHAVILSTPVPYP